MTALPEQWRVYAQKQRELDSCTSVGDTSCGLEAGLNGLLDGSASPETINRIIANAARRSRHAKSLLRRHLRPETSHDGMSCLEARFAISMIEQRLPKQQVKVLAASVGSRQLNGRERTSLSRARKSARKLVA